MKNVYPTIGEGLRALARHSSRPLLLLGLAILARCRPLIVAAIAVAAWNTLSYAAAIDAGAVTGLPVCLSMGIAFALVPTLRYRRRAHPVAVVVAMAPLLLGHLFTFGCTQPIDNVNPIYCSEFVVFLPSQNSSERLSA